MLTSSANELIKKADSFIHLGKSDNTGEFGRRLSDVKEI